MCTPHRDLSRILQCLALAILSILSSFGCATTFEASPAPPAATELVSNYVLVESITLEQALPTSPVFSTDGRYLLVGDLTMPRLLIVTLGGSELHQRTVPFVISALELSPDGRFLYAVGRYDGYGSGIARFDIDTWQTVTAELPRVQKVTDLAIDPRGDHLFLGDVECNCLYDLELPSLFREGAGPEPEGETLRRLYLESGPADEIEVLPGQDRVLTLHLEMPPSKGATYRVMSGAELSLIDTTKGTLVDWVWSQQGLGTGSILSTPRGSGAARFVVAVEEDPRKTVVAYQIEGDGRELSSRARTLASWPPTRKPLDGKLRLAGSADAGTLAILDIDEKELALLHLQSADGNAPLELIRQWTLRVPRWAEEVAVSPDARYLAVTGKGGIDLFRLESEGGQVGHPRAGR